jgi:phage tail-like protein
MAATRQDPYRNYNFRVEIGGIQQAGFSECSGFGSNIDVVEYREGNEPMRVRKLAGRTSFPNIVLKWGITASRDLVDWHQQTVDGNIQPQNGSIVLLDNQGNEVARWNFVNGWPSKWDGIDLNAKGNDVAIETLEITHEGIVRA